MNKHTALAISRAIRATTPSTRPFLHRIGVPTPNPGPQTRWTRRCIDLSAFDLGSGSNLKCPLDLAVPSSAKRIRMRDATCTVYASGCPKNAFVDLGDGIAISCPELLFVEMAEVMDPVHHLMLGHELCGRFSRNAIDPRNGDVVYHRAPLTCVERIEDFASQTKHIAGISKARETLKYLHDEAWSPMESLIAALMTLPIENLGYEMGALVLNPRVDTSPNLASVTARRYRRPDIVIAGTPFGVNYDGQEHADLSSIVNSAIQVGMSPGEQQREAELNRSLELVRTKMIDDMNRNRELAADGLVVFPATKEDLYRVGGLDRLMLQMCEAMERRDGRDMSRTRQAIMDPYLSAKRYRLIRSLLPGRPNDSQRGLLTEQWQHFQAD